MSPSEESSRSHPGSSGEPSKPNLKGFFRIANSIAPLIAAIAVIATIIWWAAWISISYDSLQQQVFKLELQMDSLEPDEIERRLQSLEFDTGSPSFNLDISSIKNDVERLEKGTVSLSVRLQVIEAAKIGYDQKHEYISTMLGSLAERTSFLMSRSSIQQGASDESESSFGREP